MIEWLHKQLNDEALKPSASASMGIDFEKYRKTSPSQPFKSRFLADKYSPGADSVGAIQQGLNRMAASQNNQESAPLHFSPTNQMNQSNATSTTHFNSVAAGQGSMYGQQKPRLANTGPKSSYFK